MRIGIISTMHRVAWGGSEELWAGLAEQALLAGIHVSVCLVRQRPDHHKWRALESAGADLFCEPNAWYLQNHRPARVAGVLHHRLGRFIDDRISPLLGFFSTRPDVVLVSDGASIPRTDVIDAIRNQHISKPYIMLSQSNHGEVVEPTHREKAASFYRDAQSALFVSQNNLLATEKQLLQKLSNARVIRNPVNLSSIDPVEWPRNETVTFASIGRLEVADKGQDILLEALSGERWRSRDWSLSIYGAGGDGEYIEGLAQYYGLSSQVFFRGQTENIRKLWETHQALVLPSRVEGTPLVLVEAMLCARPVIGTAIAGIPEWIRHGHNGFLADAPAANCFAAALETAWQQRSRWFKIGRTARQDALLLYDRNPYDTLLSIVMEGVKSNERKIGSTTLESRHTSPVSSCIHNLN
jgi:L-malate glycosyltransferase